VPEKAEKRNRRNGIVYVKSGMKLPRVDAWKTSLMRGRGPSEIGKISYCGTISGSRGIRRDQSRTFGQWAIVYLVGGSGSYHDERGTDVSVRAGDVIVVFPELAHSYGPPPGGVWNELYVCFNGPVFEVWRSAGIFDVRRPVFKWQPPSKGLAVMQEFFSQMNRPGKSMRETVAQWQGVLARVMPAGGATPAAGAATARPAWLVRALDLLERDSGAADDPSLEALASACGMGYESFRKKFTQLIGKPPARYALERRIDRARQLLARHPFTNKELADLLGFHDEFHFAKTFKKLTGRTPREEFRSFH
jgi:AraC-like DNA-binding protein